jgi:predicted outer membrane repeat protein
LYGADATFSGCTFISNNAYADGGGLMVHNPGGTITVEDTSFTNNSSPSGGGGAIDASLVTAGTALKLDRVTMTSNQGYHRDAAAFFATHAGSNDVIIEMNNVIMADNTVSFPGTYNPVVGVNAGAGGTMTLAARQLTFAGHSGMSAVRVSAYSDRPVTANLTNVLIETADNAFVGDESGTGEVTVTHTATMTNSVTNLHVTENGTPTFIANNPLTGLPHLDVRWRLQADSDAIDAGVDSGVTDDIDGEFRPFGSGFDIGADEYAPLFADGFESGSTGRWSSTIP